MTHDFQGMTVDELLEARETIQALLASKADQLEDQARRLRGEIAPRPHAQRPQQTPGSKRPIKYRGPNGEAWTGVGAKPRWLRPLLDQGRALDEFRVNAAAA